jgi:hypothetical protein
MHILSGLLLLVDRGHAVLEVFESCVDTSSDLLGGSNGEGVVNEACEFELAIVVLAIQLISKVFVV